MITWKFFSVIANELQSVLWRIRHEHDLFKIEFKSTATIYTEFQSFKVRYTSVLILTFIICLREQLTIFLGHENRKINVCTYLRVFAIMESCIFYSIT